MASTAPATVRARATRRPRREHRQRLIDAMAASIEERGYRGTTVADVVRAARTSRRTFYEHFADRDACFLALFDGTINAIMREIASSLDPSRPYEQQVDQALSIYLDSMAARPGVGQSFARELPALGEAGRARQRAVIERFADLLVELVESGRHNQPELGARPLDRDVAIMIVGGLRELSVLAAEQQRDVRDLHATVARSIKGMLGTVVLAGDAEVRSGKPPRGASQARSRTPSARA